MKRLIYIAIAAVMVSLASCKTTEANYRAAYEVARNKQMETGDSLTDVALRNQNMPRPMVIGSDTLMVRTEALTADVAGGFSNECFAKYCIVAGVFKQVFNARSMCERLRQSGYPDAFVAFNRMKDYYVMAGSTSQPGEASAMIAGLSGDKSFTFRAPYPYVMRPAHLVR